MITSGKNSITTFTLPTTYLHLDVVKRNRQSHGNHDSFNTKQGVVPSMHGVHTYHCDVSAGSLHVEDRHMSYVRT